MSAERELFLSRWSRVKTEARRQEARSVVATGDAARPAAPSGDSAPPGVEGAAPGAESAATGVDAASAREPQELPPLDTLDGLASDYRGFLQPGVDDTLRRDALKKLFADPHFNNIDPYEAYSGDYTQFEPIDAAMLKTIEHAKGLLFDEKPDSDREAPGEPDPAGQGESASALPAAQAEPEPPKSAGGLPPARE